MTRATSRFRSPRTSLSVPSSYQVIQGALERFSLELLPLRHPSAKEIREDPSFVDANMINITQQGTLGVYLPPGQPLAHCEASAWSGRSVCVILPTYCQWYNLNSTLSNPARLSMFHVDAFLTQLENEG